MRSAQKKTSKLEVQVKHIRNYQVAQPGEIALFGRAFDMRAAQSVTGEAAWKLVQKVIRMRAS